MGGVDTRRRDLRSLRRGVDDGVAT
jgi:hypothetical protein